MTIVEIFENGDIGIRACNLCLRNNIHNFEDLERHYIRYKTFRNIPYCGYTSNDQLIAMYKRYKDIDNNENRAASVSTAKGQLENVVIDLNEVRKSTEVVKDYFNGVEKSLKDSRSARSGDVPTAVESTGVVGDVEDFNEIVKTINNYKRKKASKEKRKTEAENQVAKKPWKPTAADNKTTKEIEKKTEQYSSGKSGGEATVVKPKVNTIRLEEIEKKLDEYWSKF